MQPPCEAHAGGLHRPPDPSFKDRNEVLQHRAEITDGKYLREAVYGLKEPPQEETVEIIRMSEVDTQTVEWLCPFVLYVGKKKLVKRKEFEKFISDNIEI